MVIAKSLHSIGVRPFESPSEADLRKIEIVTGRKYPFGNHIKESLSSLPEKVEMKMKEMECPSQGKSKLVITLTRLLQSLQFTKRHYVDMVVGVEEDNLIIFHEKIRVVDFPSPYSATILLSSPQQGKLTVKAGLIFEDFLGIDLHQKVISMKETNSNVVYKHGMKHISSFAHPNVL
ncbi:putative ATP-dependent DNA helicase HFM1 [Heracleum sosnowskyi]|uniref:ATP-dependent DNA helicase HFM1 n=1 Tax=Heracleum sosnowskyi TaxID=360622 RepID=A0AAD8H1Z5_9APIA|nr:putative ATP-dependent DNA helicase HFM1 [Heracleum sosnowskyi]